jgi:hypothetical protein
MKNGARHGRRETAERNTQGAFITRSREQNLLDILNKKKKNEVKLGMARRVRA